MKKRRKIILLSGAGVVLAAVVVCVVLVATGKVGGNAGNIAGFKPLTAQFGTRPADITAALVKSGALFDGLRLADGYVRYTDGNLYKYDLKGKLIWKIENLYTYDPETAAYLKETETGDSHETLLSVLAGVTKAGGGFYRVQNSCYFTGLIDFSHLPAGVTLPPAALERYDDDGNRLWRHEFAKNFHIEYTLTLADGGTLAAGTLQPAAAASGAAQGVYLAKLDGRGQLTADKTINIGGGAVDPISSAACVPGKGIAIAYPNGINAGGTGGDDVTLYDEGLTQKAVISTPYTISQMRVFGGRLYGMDGLHDGYRQELVEIKWDGTVTKIASLGKGSDEYYAVMADAPSPFGGPIVGPLYLSGSAYGQYYFYDGNGQCKLKMDSPYLGYEGSQVTVFGGKILFLEKEAVGYLSDKANSGEADTAAYEQVYCCYDTNGKLLWRGAYPLYTKAQQAQITSGPEAS